MNGLTPKVTIGIPFYNSKATLLDAIRSVFAQSFRDWELILIDDGSTDGSVKIAQGVNDPRVKVIEDGEHLGLALRLNQIAKLAHGKFLARMDADDLLHPNRMTNQVKYLEDNPYIDVLSAGTFVLDENGTPIGKRVLPDVPDSVRDVLARVCLIHASVLGKREWFIKNPYDPNYNRAEDRELWCRAYINSRFANLTDCYYFYKEYDSFSLVKYVASCRTNAAICWKYGLKYEGFMVALRLSLKELMKIPVYALAYLFGYHRSLIKNRSLPLNSDEMKAAIETLARIKATVVPMYPGIVAQ